MRRLTSLLLFLVIGLAGCEDSPVEPLQKFVEGPQSVLIGAAMSIDAGGGHTCAIESDGGVVCWGFSGGQTNVPSTLGTVSQVSAGTNTTCVLETDGGVACWGVNTQGETNVPATLGTATQVSAGSSHACALQTDGRVVCWGGNLAGQINVPGTLGAARQVSASSGSHTCAIRTDGSVVCWGSNASGQTTVPATLGSATQVSAGGLFTCVLKSDGGVVCWGNNTSGQRNVPATLGTAIQVSAGVNHACALKNDGGVVCWGENASGQTNVPATLGRASQVAAGGNHSCALKTDGGITCWGSSPGGLVQGSFSDVSAGRSHTCAFETDGDVVCWGENRSGQTNVPESLGAVAQLSAGIDHTCVLDSDGGVVCWGANGAGQINVPGTLNAVRQVSAGNGSHTCVLQSDGGVVCWGSNGNGQTNVPATLGSATQVSAGGAHTCAVRSDGGIACWGSNFSGQSNVPAALGTATQVSAGGGHTCALRNDGGVVCWGDNARGQTNVPPTLSMATQVSAGTAHNCALRAGGEVVCWGANFSGQISVPTDLGSVIRLSVNANQSCVVKLDNTIECWGNPTSTTFVPGDPGATPTGSDVSLSPRDQSTGEPAPVSLHFSNVTGSGTTTVTSGTVGTSGPPAPNGFRLGSPPTFYDVQTTALFTGPVELCFDYSGTSYGNENNLKLLHHENGVWTDVTTSLHTDNNVICGTVTSLSPFLVAEQNVAPIITGIALPNAPVALGTTVSVTAAFSDGNPNDTHTANLDWNDGTTSIAAISESAGAGSAGGSHTYSAPGVFTVAGSVSDGDLTGTRSSISDEPAYIVVYDPSSGFVTGGGWLDSPAGACLWSGCAGDGSTTGRASFGFVSRYRPGAKTPTGNTEFQFKAGDLRFHSTSYQWLVVAGARAQYKGEGEIAGDAASYGFLITAIDGALVGGGEADRFRIKLWNLATGAVVYDNQISQPEDSGAATVIGGGSIVIHK